MLPSLLSGISWVGISPVLSLLSSLPLLPIAQNLIQGFPSILKPQNIPLEEPPHAPAVLRGRTVGFGLFPPGCPEVGRPHHPYSVFLGGCNLVVASVLGAAARIEATPEIWALRRK